MFVRSLRIGAMVLFGVWSAYVLVANLLIASGVVQYGIHAAQDNVRLEWERAYSLFPGHACAHGLTIITQDTQVELEIDVDRAETVIGFSALLDKTFAGHGGSARGVRVRMREVRPLDKLCAVPQGRLPPIGRLSQPRGDEAIERCLAQQDTSMKPTGITSPDRLWRVHLSDLSVRELREVWVEQDRLLVAGDLELAGYFWPTQRLELSASSIDIDKATLSRGGRVLARDLIGTLQIRVEPVSLSTSHVLQEIARSLSCEMDLEGDVDSLGILEVYLRKAKWLELGEGRGHLRAHGRIDQGVFRKGTSIRVDNADLNARGLEHVASGKGTFAFEVEESKAGVPIARAKFALDRFRLRRAIDKKPHLEGRGLAITIKAQHPTIIEPLENIELAVVLGAARIPELQYYQVYVPKNIDFHILAGTATASGELHVTQNRNADRGHFRVSSNDVVATYHELRTRARLDVDLQVTRANLENMHFEIAGSELRVRDGLVVENDKAIGGPPFLANLTIRGGSFSVGKAHEGASEFSLDAAVHTQASSVRPLLSVFGAGGNLPGWVRNLNPGQLTGDFLISISPEGFAIDQLQMRAGALEAYANLRDQRGDAEGGLLLGFGGLRLGIEIDRGQSSLRLVDPTNTYYRRARERRNAK